MPNPINYAAQYGEALANNFPYVLHFGALYATPNNGRYQIGETGKTCYIPSIKTTGRIDTDRDTIAAAARNYDNAWEPKVLKNQRSWSTLVHPKDVDQTNGAASIANITRTFNESKKFPEMDAYCVSELYNQWITDDATHGYVGRTPDTTALTVNNILDIFDEMMVRMDDENVPADGRILYCTSTVKAMLKKANGIQRTFGTQDNVDRIDRTVNRLDEVEIIGVPARLMKTAYDFTTGFVPEDDADQIDMFLVHPLSVVTPVSYQFAKLDEPSALTHGKYFYYEESFEDVFILNNMADGLQFHITAHEDP